MSMTTNLRSSAGWTARAPPKRGPAALTTTPQRLATMANLVDIAMADGALAGAERELLEAYVTAFGIAESEVEKMVAVIAVKNDRSVFA